MLRAFYASVKGLQEYMLLNSNIILIIYLFTYFFKELVINIGFRMARSWSV